MAEGERQGFVLQDGSEESFVGERGRELRAQIQWPGCLSLKPFAIHWLCYHEQVNNLSGPQFPPPN